MRVLVRCGILWLLLTFLIGIAGYWYVEAVSDQHVQDDLLRDASVFSTTVSIRAWPIPAESDPDWRELETRFNLSAVPIDRSLEGATEEVVWKRVASGRYRLATVVPMLASGDGAAGLQITRDIDAPTMPMLWLLGWGGTSATALLFVAFLMGYVRSTTELQKRNLRMWVDRSRFREGDRAMPPDFELPGTVEQEADLEQSLRLVAESYRVIYADYKNANDRSELVLGNLREGVLAVDDQARVLLANTALKRLLELPQQHAFVYRPFLEVVRIPAISELINAVLSERVPYDKEGEFGNPSKYLSISARPLPLGAGRMGALITIRDDTLIKRVELIRRDFVANASHELRTPLAAIRAYAETLQLGALDDRETAENFVGSIISQADRIDGLVSGMLQLSRVEVGTALNFEAIDVAKAIRPCVIAAQAVAQTKRVDLVFDETMHLVISTDRDSFQTIVSNLLSNAVRYTPAGGSVSLRASIEGSTLELEVEDTGIGIPPEDLERIFERFYRAEKGRSSDTGGTGLGLAIVKHLATALGGRVDATSRLNKGSVFRVSLPVAGAADR